MNKVRWYRWVYRTRLTWAMPVVLLFCVLIAWLYFRITYETTAVASLRHSQLEEAAQMLYRRAQTIDYALAQRDLAQVQASISAFATDITYEQAFVTDADGRILAALHLRDRNTTLAEIVPRLCCVTNVSTFQDRMDELQYAGEAIVRLSDDGRRLMSMARVSADLAAGVLRPSQFGVFYIQRDLESLYAAARRTAQRRALEVFLIGSVLAIAVWVFFHVGFTRVIARLQSAADRLASGDLSARIGIKNGRSEMGRLSESFDAMAIALQWRELEHAHNDKALRQSEAEARALAEQSPLGIFMGQIDGRVRYANRAIHELLALPSGSSVNPDWIQYVHRDDKAAVSSAWQQLLNDQHTKFSVECRILGADGQEHWVHVVATAIRDDDVLIGYVGTVLDTTVARRLNRAIEAAAAPVVENERFFQQLLKRLAQLTGARCAYIGLVDEDALEFIRIHTLWCDGQTHDGLRFPLKGSPCARVLQSTSAFYPSGAQDTFPTQELLREMHVESFLGAALHNAEEKAFGVLVIVDDMPMVDRPEVRSVLQICAARVAGELMREQAILRQQNITKELERSVAERTAQLEVANKELEAFSYSVSHDLRAPLRGIDGFSQALLEDASDRLTDVDRNYLSRIRVAAQRMGYLIDDLLKLSRVTRQEMTVQVVNLSNVASELAKELSAQDPARSVEWVIATNILVNGDAALLHVALINLLDNAWKYTSKTAGARIEVGRREQDGAWVYFVKDNGAGFDMRHAGRLFTAFQRLHRADEFPGTGVGLATVARVIHRHGGIIWGEAAEGKGATFYFTLQAPAASVVVKRQVG